MVKFKTAKDYKPGEILIPNLIIRERIKEVAEEIAKDYKNKELLIVGVLKGAFKLVSDLTHDLHELGLKDLKLTFVVLKTYEGIAPKEESQLLQDMDIHPQGRHVLVVDDILDTGKSLKFITELLESKGSKSVKSFALLDKPSGRSCDFCADYVGIKIPNIWVQGYGMDTDEFGRAEPNIIVGPYKYQNK